MTSFGTDKQVTHGGFQYTFKMQGQAYHTIGSLLPMQDEDPKYLQIYFMGDPKTQAQRRHQVVQGTRLDLIRALQIMFNTSNELVRSF